MFSIKLCNSSKNVEQFGNTIQMYQSNSNVSCLSRISFEFLSKPDNP